MIEKKAALHSLGCKVNSYETQAMEESLINAGYSIVPFDETADVYVINTCTVTSVSDKKSRQMIRRARKNNPDAIVVACGCFTQKEGLDISKDLPECDIILGNNHKSELIERINLLQSHVSDINKQGTEYERLTLSLPMSKTRGFIKVQDGCDRYCAYCIIPYVRGISRSREASDIIAEAKSYAKGGCKEIVLCAINLSSYYTKETDLKGLIKSLNDIEGIERIRLGSLEPDVFTEEFVSTISACEKVCPHFHFSLQSACDKTLHEMNRRYTFDSCLHGVNTLRKYYDNPAIWADVIAGFSGETKEDFKESLDNIKTLKLTRLHVFPYSERKGTRAANRSDNIPKPIRDERAHILMEYSDKAMDDYAKSFIGKNISVLLEEEQIAEGKRYMAGFTKEYVRALVKGGKSGDIIEGVAEFTFDGQMLIMTETR